MKFKLDYHGVKDFLYGSEVEAMLRKAGEEVAKSADEEAPVGETGELSNSHYVEIDYTDRVVARVKSDKEYAAAVAARTGYMTRALDKGI